MNEYDRPVGIESRGARLARRGVIWIVWPAIALIAGILGLEIFLQVLTTRRESVQAAAVTPLEQAYYPFSIQHLHPHYLFFFPLDPAKRVAIGNAVCSIDRDGFREPGLAHAGGRKLAVLLGGSAAFGYLSSSNATTITSYLNRLQTEYFFVNAAVPSWNSTQELFRLSLQIAPLKPALVITYDGANDASLAGMESGHAVSPYPAGTPESFDKLDALVGDVRVEQKLWSPFRLFPQLMHRLEKYGYAGTPPGPEVGTEAAARQYLSNQTQMAALAAGMGARFINVIQPIGYLHQRGKQSADGDGDLETPFYRLVRAAPPTEFYDFSSVFDDLLSATDSSGRRVELDALFMDDVHLTDRGNEIVAQRLWQLIHPAANQSTP